MAQITLRDYQQKLEDLLQQRRNDEVVQHCRHLLGIFPKNAGVHRAMGKALVASGRYDEAEAVFQRVLSVYPDDQAAHQGLSLVAQHRNRGDDAIWHAERAFEQDANDPQVLQALRDLLHQYRGQSTQRIPLTARAVAAGQVRNGLYPKAIDTLQRALAQTPDRLDLQTLLAQVLWEGSFYLPAAEAALQILKTLPDCLEANRILTMLWLREGRPSDAQRYLSRVEAVEPYMAFELAQSPAPDSALRVPELDYEREASRQTATSSPDWLQSFAQIMPETDDDMALLDAVEVDDAPDFGALLDFDADDDAALTDDDDDQDWLQALENSQTDADVNNRAVRGDQFKITDESLADLFGDDEDDADSAPSTGTSTTGLTGLLSSIGNRQGGSTGLTGLLNAMDADEDTAEEEEPDDWMRAVNKPTAPLRDPYAKKSDTDRVQNVLDELADADDASPAFEEDPLAWLNADNAAKPPTDDLVDPQDPLAWMRGSGVELVEDAPAMSYKDFLAADAADDVVQTFNTPNANDPLAWMQSAGVELVDDAEATALPAWAMGDEAPTLNTDDLPSNDDADPMAWMKQSGVEWADDDEDDKESTRRKRVGMLTPGPKPAAPASASPPPPAPKPAAPASVNWLGDDAQLDDLLSLETIVEQGTGILQTPAAQAPQDATMDDNDNLIPNWLTDDEDDASDLPSATNVGGLEWLTDEDEDSDEDDAALDWMSEPAIPDLFDDMSDTDADEAPMFGLPATPAANDALPSWLAAAGLGVAQANDDNDTEEEQALPNWLASATPSASPSRGMFNMAQTTDDDDDNFTLDLSAEDEDDAVAEPASSTPDWLSGMGMGATAT
ncbi:MAG: tetratricopeptide repeat protein, partial [Armatimonadetes bacterium]|nr:tetratricopeptide repeat protein [Anaerolineae bacterium]